MPRLRRSSSSSCIQAKSTIDKPGFIPRSLQNLTCLESPDCYPVTTTVQATSSSQTEKLSLTVACLQRVSCVGIKNMKVEQKRIGSKSNGKIIHLIKCDPGREISVMVPRISPGQVKFKKVVYDCQCPCEWYKYLPYLDIYT